VAPRKKTKTVLKNSDLRPSFVTEQTWPQRGHFPPKNGPQLAHFLTTLQKTHKSHHLGPKKSFERKGKKKENAKAPNILPWAKGL